MRIIVDNGAYTLRNIGDVAMLQVAISRIRRLYPSAEVLVLTGRPDLLKRYCPGTLPLPTASRTAAYAHPNTVRQHAAAELHSTRTILAHSNPRLVAGHFEEFDRAFTHADMLVVAGGGYLNDLNAEAAFTVLQMAKHGLDAGKQVAFLSQGLGPLTSPALLDLFSEVCRRGAYIGLREPCCGPATVLRAGAAHSRWAVTGDDAIQLAYEEPPAARIENLIGFSVRCIAYSGIREHQMRQISCGLSLLREKTGAGVLPLPVSFNSFENDSGAIETITGEAVKPLHLDTPHEILAAAGRCRIVVAGAYHAAVFALAQGVPCVCLHASPYYRDKMQGLAAQFGHGCSVIDISNGNIATEIATRGLELWGQSPEYRKPLIRRAGEQVRASQRFCQVALSCATPRAETLSY